MEINKCILNYSPNISWGKVEKEVFIFNEETHKVYLLRDYLAIFWVSISPLKCVSDVIRELNSIYNISPSTERKIQRGVMRCIENKLLVINEDTCNE